MSIKSIFKKKISWKCFTNTAVSTAGSEQMDRLWQFHPFSILKKRREAKVGRGGKAQERNLSNSDKKFIPFQTCLICNTSVTRGGFSWLCAHRAQTADTTPHQEPSHGMFMALQSCSTPHPMGTCSLWRRLCGCLFFQ